MTARTRSGTNGRRQVIVLAMVLLAPLLLWSAAPGAAQDATDGKSFEAEVVLEPLTKPVALTAVLNGTVAFTCVQPRHYQTPSNFEVHAELGSDLGVTSVSPAGGAIEVDPVRCAAGETVATVPFSVQVTLERDAPARAELPLDVRVTGEELKEEARAQTQITVAFVAAAQARLDLNLVKTAPGSPVTLPLTIENEANGPLRFQVRAGANTSEELGLVDLPTGVTVPPNVTRMTQLPVTVTTTAGSGYTNEQHTLVLHVEMWDPADASNAIQPVTLTAVIQVQGTSMLGHAPAPPLAPLLLGLLAALALTRRQFA